LVMMVFVGGINVIPRESVKGLEPIR